jgi:hypothetical protein
MLQDVVESSGAWNDDLAPPMEMGEVEPLGGVQGSPCPPAEERKEENEERLVDPVPVVVPGKVKIMQRRNRDENSEFLQKGNGDGKKDLSSLPFEEREQAYQQARARIFGENDAANVLPEVSKEDSNSVAQDPKTDQRKRAEMRMAQDRMNDMNDPAYNRSLWCNSRNPYSGSSSYTAAPSDPSNDPRVKAAEAAQAVLAAQRAQALFAQAGIYNPVGPPGSWRPPGPTGSEPVRAPSPVAQQQLAQQLQFLAQQLQMRAPQMTPQQFQQAQMQLQLQMQQFQQQQMLYSQQRPPFPVGLQQNPQHMN